MGEVGRLWDRNSSTKPGGNPPDTTQPRHQHAAADEQRFRDVRLGHRGGGIYRLKPSQGWGLGTIQAMKVAVGPGNIDHFGG